MSFDPSYPKTLASLQLFRDTLNVNRIYLHQVGDNYIPYRLFTMKMQNNKVQSANFKNQRVWVAVPAIDTGNNDLFKMMQLFFANEKMNCIMMNAQMHDVYVPHYANNWNNAADNAYFRANGNEIQFDEVMYNDMTNRAISDNRLVLSTVLFPISVTPCVTYTQDVLASHYKDFQMPVINQIATLCEFDLNGESPSPSKPVGLHSMPNSERKVLRGVIRLGNQKAATLIGELYDTGSGKSRAETMMNKIHGKASMYVAGSLFPITSNDGNTLTCRFALNITAYDPGGSSAAPAMPDLELPAPTLEAASLDLGALPLPFSDTPSTDLPKSEVAVQTTEKQYM